MSGVHNGWVRVALLWLVLGGVGYAAARTAIVTISDPVLRGNRLGISVKTAPLSHCNLEVSDPGGHPVHQAGLQPKKADNEGFVHWAITLTPKAEVGIYRVVVRVTAPDGVKSTAKGKFTVTP